MSAIEVEKRVLIPERKGGGRNRKYPWDKLKVGDSFFIPHASKGFSIYSCLKHYNNSVKKKDNISVTQRREEGGLRVWRTK